MSESWQDLVDLARLTEWMNVQGIGSGSISDVSQLTGGTQNILLRFSRGTDQFILRRPPRHPRMNGNDIMRREARVLKGLSGTDVPHPRLIAACDSDEVLGVSFYLMEDINGFNATTGMPALHATDPDMRRQMGLALADGIATLARVHYTAIGLADLGKPDGFLQRQVARWQGQLASYAEYAGWPGPSGIPGVERVARWLDDNRPESSVPGILHGDYHLANVLYRFDSPNLAAIVDWELCSIGDPLVDLGWLIATWPDNDGTRPGSPVVVKPWKGFPSAADLVARYRSSSARDLSAIDWYKVFACFKLGIILEGSHARACAGKAPKAIGDRLHATALGLFGRALNWM